MKKLLYILLITPLFFISSCEEDDVDENVVIELGAIYQGGMIFHIDQTGEHGLVAALQDLEGLYEWGCYGTTISGADGALIGTGYQNTLDIVAGCSATPIAASEALAYESEGYSDWYLPSIDELLEMYNTIGQGGPDGNIGGFEGLTNGWYWSSLGYGNNYAWTVYFYSGVVQFRDKNETHRVRAIRSF
jgi:hypothetical protein